MWKSYIQGLLDYGSQIWGPIQLTQLLRLELLQKNYSGMVYELSNKNYWERLEALKMYSINRRFQRYTIMYLWKVMENKVDNFGLKWNWNERRGRMVDLPKRAKNSLGNKLREQTLSVRGGRVFNSLPIYLRNCTDVSLDVFKQRLDTFLTLIPDHPYIHGMYLEPTDTITGKQSNNIQDWILYLNLGDRRSMDTEEGNFNSFD